MAIPILAANTSTSLNTDTPKPPKFSAMDLPEIRDIVFQYLGRRDLARCTRISKSWHGPAMAMIWKSVELSGAHRRNPPFEILQRHCNLVKAFRISLRFIGWTGTEYSTLNFPKLEKITMTLSNASSADMLDLIRRHTCLMHLALTYQCTHRTSFLNAPQLWEAIASLPNLSTLHICDVEVLNATVSLPRLRELRLLYSGGTLDIASQQLQFINRCPALEILEWHPNCTVRWLGDPATKNFVKLANAGAWPNLESLILGRDSLDLSDSNIASILAAIPRATILGLSDSKFGPLSFESLRAHFPILKELDLDDCLKHCIAVTEDPYQTAR
ncbi:hypothetical protein BC939DRAFT_521511 [Gamsiella multidivaricata]|uniref:uncharacterized protein n=1 Tax=Gamsiella multidivaricata TaxID=101098 RepID=UPI002220045F|nr:uncharacterized protein BC939DRAFT_521511 [Gamsiella multidivaricata]KAI7818792.1 hypothetical protein BC939DRAFT_521511 [Gamsiella multidivaricata]